MGNGYKPQETSMNSFTEAERDLYHHFVERGYSEEIASAIARNFTQFMLGYITAEGAAQFIMLAGADAETAREMAELFRDAKEGSRRRNPRSSRQLAGASV